MNALYGYIFKLLVDVNIIKVPNLRSKIDNNLIISLTSYGRRVKHNIVYYTLVSLLRQSFCPTKIILWLARDEWNEENLPKDLLKLKEKGIDILFCDDLKSFKKLIPTLEQYYNQTIITVDDDIIYNKNTILQLMREHERNPNDIICLTAKEPIFKEGIPHYYKSWKEYKNNATGMFIFPIGVGGILYPPKSLCKDVLRKDVFMTLCPHADDIWFWFCGLRNKTNKRYIMKKGIDLSFDNLYQYFHKGSALSHKNNTENQNDFQFNALFKYYKYKIE